MTTTEKQTIQKVINTLNAYIPVTDKNNMDAKLGCIMTLENLIAQKEETQNEK